MVPRMVGEREWGQPSTRDWGWSTASNPTGLDTGRCGPAQFIIDAEAVLSDAGWGGMLEILIDAAVGGWLVGVLSLWHRDTGKAAVKRGTLPRGSIFNCRLTEAAMPRGGMASTVQPCKTFAKIEKR